MRRFLGRLGRIKFLHPLCQDMMALWRGGWIDAELPAPPDTEVPTAVMTVAHEEACYAAMRYAKRHQLPLITIFHDWWPDVPEMHQPFRAVLQRSFHQLYQESSLALCVSPGMKEALGQHQNSKVMLPMPAIAKTREAVAGGASSEPFRVLYAGNLAEYGPMLMEALNVFKDHPHIRFEVRGAKPMWPAVFTAEMSERGLFLPFAQRDEFDTWLKSADAFLITQSFDEEKRRLMKTNFPSKLVEYAQYGKPLILWGPDDSSGPIWARKSGQGLVVDQKDPQCLVLALEQLYGNKVEQERLAHAANKAASSSFNPELIQAEFMRCLYGLVN